MAIGNFLNDGGFLLIGVVLTVLMVVVITLLPRERDAHRWLSFWYLPVILGGVIQWWVGNRETLLSLPILIAVVLPSLLMWITIRRYSKPYSGIELAASIVLGFGIFTSALMSVIGEPELGGIAFAGVVFPLTIAAHCYYFDLESEDVKTFLQTEEWRSFWRTVRLPISLVLAILLAVDHFHWPV